MNTLEHRIMVYTALVLLCSAVSAVAGPVAGLWSFVQVAAVVELVFWLGVPAESKTDQFKSLK